MLVRDLRSIRLSRRSAPFDSSDWIFEIKHDGFRALAIVENGKCQLVSRNGNVFRGFKELAEWVGPRLKCNAVLDGEIVVLDQYGLVSSFVAASNIAATAFVRVWRLAYPNEFGANFFNRGIGARHCSFRAPTV
jgi:ATP-dependent DNA ligase